MNLRRSLIAAGVIFTLASGRLSAALIALDDFNYASGGDLNGQSGGGSFGFSDAWTGNSTFDIGNGSLVSPVSQAPGVGNRMSAASYSANRDIHRTLTAPLGAPGTTNYFSFLLQPNGLLHEGFAQGWFGFVLSGGFPVYVDMGSFTNKYGIEVSGTSSLSSTTATIGQTVFVVLRIDFSGGGVDPARIYINPLPGNEPVVASAAVLENGIGSVTTVGLTGPGAYSFDTLKIGTSWADVAPVPEPSTLALAPLGTLALWAINRRLRN